MADWERKFQFLDQEKVEFWRVLQEVLTGLQSQVDQERIAQKHRERGGVLLRDKADVTKFLNRAEAIVGQLRGKGKNKDKLLGRALDLVPMLKDLRDALAGVERVIKRQKVVRIGAISGGSMPPKNQSLKNR